jgi:hypothetical protein
VGPVLTLAMRKRYLSRDQILHSHVFKAITQLWLFYETTTQRNDLVSALGSVGAGGRGGRGL